MNPTQTRYLGACLTLAAMLLQFAGMMINSSIASRIDDANFEVAVDAGPSQVRMQITRAPNGSGLPAPYDTKVIVLTQNCDASTWDFEPAFTFPMTIAGAKACHAVKACFGFFCMMMVGLCVASVSFVAPMVKPWESCQSPARSYIPFISTFLAFTVSGIGNLTPLIGTKAFTNELDAQPFVATGLGTSAFLFMTASVLTGVAMHPAYQILPLDTTDTDKAMTQDATIHSGVIMAAEVKRAEIEDATYSQHPDLNALDVIPSEFQGKVNTTQGDVNGVNSRGCTVGCFDVL